MTAWEQEKSSEDYKKRVEVSQLLTDAHRELKNAAHAARQAFAGAMKINDAILRGSRLRKDLSNAESTAGRLQLRLSHSHPRRVRCRLRVE